MSHRFTRQELYDLVWSEPMKKLAPRYQISDVALAKACRRADIPVRISVIVITQIARS